jgi:hypothetical protein
VFNEEAFERLSTMSVSHLYNLRKTRTYRLTRQRFHKTQAKPQPSMRGANPVLTGNRADTVHQGDLDKQKGVYHINAVDEETQFEVVASVAKISEHYLIPILEQMLETFPFKILGFHSDLVSLLKPSLIREVNNEKIPVQINDDTL